MKYELIKKLKDAGYVFKLFPWELLLQTERATENFGALRLDGELYFRPTLEELLGSMQGRYKYVDGLINDAQVCLRKTLSDSGEVYIAWLDGDWESDQQKRKYRFVAPTPSEAVANLWIELQKK